MSRTLTTSCSPRHIAEMNALAAEGLSRREISAITGWCYKTVRRHVGHIVRGVGAPTADLNRYRRMIRAASGSTYGERQDIARRFGLKNAKVLDVVLMRARRRVAEADQISAGSC